jgi:hypothetical protein
MEKFMRYTFVYNVLGLHFTPFYKWCSFYSTAFVFNYMVNMIITGAARWLNSTITTPHLSLRNRIRNSNKKHALFWKQKQ